jgi:hypothetical protein
VQGAIHLMTGPDWQWLLSSKRESYLIWSPAPESHSLFNDLLLRVLTFDGQS